MEEVTNRKILYFAYVAVTIVLLVSVLQGFFFGLAGHWSFYNIAAIGLAAASIYFGTKFLKNRTSHLLARIILLYCAQLAFFTLTLIDNEFNSAPRLLKVVLILLHCAIVVSAAISRFNPLVWPSAIVGCAAVVALIFLAEVVLPSSSGLRPEKRIEGVKRSIGTESHPTLQVVHRPNSTYRDYYRDNPGGYFKQADVKKIQWWFRTAEKSEAEALHSPENPDLVRVDIKKAESKIPYDIQLNLTNLKVQSQQKYRIRFRGRSDRPRTIMVGFARSHEPWTGLGFYKQLDLTSEWMDFQQDFTATASDSNGRIHFDLGESDIPVEFSNVELLHMPDAKVIEPDQLKYFVEYRFNGMGCRGSDYAIPKPAGTRRILVLGDRYAMGAGVNEEDTFSSSIETALNQKVPQYEVINCGVDEYGVQQSRLFYKFYGSQYQPGLVVLILTGNANRTVLEKLDDRGPLFYTWNRFWKIFRPYDFSDSMDEILQLNRRLHNDGSRLAVVSFRNNSDYAGSTELGKEWNELTRIASRELQNARIPFLDLGNALYAKHSARDLMVSPPAHNDPNHKAHALAAQEILEFLQKQALL